MDRLEDFIDSLTKEEQNFILEIVNEKDKLKMKLKMMEISFEQINNSRNDMIRQLAELELSIKNDIDLKKFIEKKVNYYVKQMDRVEYQLQINLIDEFIHVLREILVKIYEAK